MTKFVPAPGMWTGSGIYSNVTIQITYPDTEITFLLRLYRCVENYNFFQTQTFIY